MRTILMGMVLLTLAAPAAAIGKGECCATVNGACISKCNKSSCTGEGDCDLAQRLQWILAADGDGGAALIAQGECCAWVHGACILSCQKSSCTGKGDCRLVTRSGGAASGSELEAVLTTLNRRDQTILRRDLEADADPPRGGERPDYEPVQGLVGPPSPGGIPAFKQLGSAQANVPMKHGSCGLDCGTHVLAVQSGNLDVPARVEMSCPTGTVDHVAYQLEGQNVKKLIEAPTGFASFSKDVKVQPFSKQELEEACQQALGGSWPLPDFRESPSKSVKKTIKEDVTVWGGCSNGTNDVSRIFPVTLTLTCTDKDWYVPKP